jgi:hypothetical protein
MTGDKDMDAILMECFEVLRVKGNDYTLGQAELDRLHNFRTAAEFAGITLEQAWLIYAYKHFSAVARYCKDGKVDSEGIKGRIVDLINYCLLLAKAVAESDLPDEGAFRDGGIEGEGDLDDFGEFDPSAVNPLSPNPLTVAIAKAGLNVFKAAMAEKLKAPNGQRSTSTPAPTETVIHYGLSIVKSNNGGKILVSQEDADRLSVDGLPGYAGRERLREGTIALYFKGSSLEFAKQVREQLQSGAV